MKTCSCSIATVRGYYRPIAIWIAFQSILTTKPTASLTWINSINAPRSVFRVPPPTNTIIFRQYYGFPSSSTIISKKSPSRYYNSRMSTSVSSSSIVVDNRVFKRAKKDDGVIDDIEPLKPSTKVIGTHSGTFQADEAMGCWMLRQLPDYYQSTIIRSRDMSVLEPLDIVIDVGGVYDHNLRRYDHHQRDYDEKFDNNRCTKLSASGLVYRHYGKDVIQQHYPNLTPTYLTIAYHKLYDSLLEALDAIDTGVEMAPPGVSLLYRDSTGLSSRVSRLNPRWNEEADDEPPNPDERFVQAMELCGIDFMSSMINIVESYLPARAYVEQALQQRFETCSTGQILRLPAGGLPWQSHLYHLEKEYNLTDPTEQLIKFVLYTDQGGMWRVQAVTEENAKFTNRISLPEPWRGVRDDELTSVTQIEGSRFCHAAGFIGGNDTFEGALKMAQVAIAEHNNNSKMNKE
jgi:uncharacterized UPF0160 family protein